MAPRACFLLLCFAAALGQATDDSVCMLQNAATASGEVVESGEATEDKPFNPFWWMGKAKETKQWPWPAKEVKTKVAGVEPTVARNEETATVAVPETPPVTATLPPARAVAKVAVPETPAVTATLPPARAVAKAIDDEPEVPEKPSEVKELEKPEYAEALEAEPQSVSAGLPARAHKWHMERKYAADYPGGPTLAVRQRLQKRRLAANKERKEQLKKKWHQRQVTERKHAEMLKVQEHGGDKPYDMELRRKEAHARQQTRKEEEEARTREQVKAEKKRNNQKRKQEWEANAEHRHWENEARLRKAARATKAKMMKQAKEHQHAAHAKEPANKPATPSSKVVHMLEKEQKRAQHREEILVRKYGHEVKPVLQQGVVNLKVRSPSLGHTIDAKVPAQARLEVLTKVAATRLGVAPETARLRWGHRKLSGQVTVAAYGLKDGDELQLEQVSDK